MDFELKADTIMPESQHATNNAIQDAHSFRPNLHFPRPGDIRATQRQQASSPLQVSQSSSIRAGECVSPSVSRIESPNIPKGDSGSPSSTTSPINSHSRSEDESSSPRGTTGRMPSSESRKNKEETGQQHVGDVQSSGSTTPKGYPLRKLSSPLSPTDINSDPTMREHTSFSVSSGLARTVLPGPKPVPRTSSIDSAISSISSIASHSPQPQQELSIPLTADISNLIATAGSPELVIQHLLKEKKHSAAQNAQLWRLVDKQRALVLGLNKDLDRAVKDKERYKRKLKEHLAQALPVTNTAMQVLPEASRALNDSPALSDSQDEQLPIQRHSIENNVATSSDGALVTQPPDLQSGRVYSDLAQSTGNSLSLPSPEESRVSQGTAVGKTATSYSKELEDDPSWQAFKPQGLQTTRTTYVSRPETDNITETPLNIPHDMESNVSPSSFTARRSLTSPRKLAHVLPVESKLFEKQFERNSPILRKPPPAPLKLRKQSETSTDYGPEDHSGSDYDDVIEVQEIPAFERGRKKTREEDDREREALLFQEQEKRSRSKKDTSLKPPSEKPDKRSVVLVKGAKETPMSPLIKGFSPPEMTVGSDPPTEHASLAGMLSAPAANSNLAPKRTHLSPGPLSPGLPSSPRPGSKFMALPSPRLPRDGASVALTSPPLSPRNGFPGVPLSPRAPRHPIPLPPHTPTSMFSPSHSDTQEPPKPSFSTVSPDHDSGGEANRDNNMPTSSQGQTLEPHNSGGVYRGLVSDTYPDLLLPPNALPSIVVKVASSRLKPSRNSSLNMNRSDDDPVFTLSIFARADLHELWHVEKPLMSLPALDQQVKKLTRFNLKLPDRSLFNGHAPAKIDARRMAMEKYFEALLDTPMDERAALVVCRYFSTQVDDSVTPSIQVSSPTTPGLIGRLVKEGYLTKRGKNFGGWKARFFVLNEPILRYYESPGGPILGNIKLQNAQIGKQATQISSQSPSRGEDDPESQYRHAFVILEPKKKDSTSVMRHVLCAESDSERDHWVQALLQYVEDRSLDDDRSRSPTQIHDSGSGKQSLLQPKSTMDTMTGERNMSFDSASSDPLQSVKYDDTVAADVPARFSPVGQTTEMPSPTTVGLPVQAQQMPVQNSKTISAPTNGTIIQNAGAWGNRPLESPKAKDKEHKKRSIWGFRDKPSTDFGPTTPTETSAHATRLERNPNARAVFGIPLAEAVECCPPTGIEICLPAVVYRCLQYLEAKDAASEEGIFRMSGSNVVIKALRERFNTEGDFDFLADGQYYDVHAVASLLKLYLRELPSSVLTRDLHLDFLQVMGMSNRSCL